MAGKVYAPRGSELLGLRPFEVERQELLEELPIGEVARPGAGGEGSFGELSENRRRDLLEIRLLGPDERMRHADERLLLLSHAVQIELLYFRSRQ